MSDIGAAHADCLHASQCPSDMTEFMQEVAEAGQIHCARFRRAALPYGYDAEMAACVLCDQRFQDLCEACGTNRPPEHGRAPGRGAGQPHAHLFWPYPYPCFSSAYAGISNVFRVPMMCSLLVIGRLQMQDSAEGGPAGARLLRAGRRPSAGHGAGAGGAAGPPRRAEGRPAAAGGAATATLTATMPAGVWAPEPGP